MSYTADITSQIFANYYRKPEQVDRHELLQYIFGCLLEEMIFLKSRITQTKSYRETILKHLRLIINRNYTFSEKLDAFAWPPYGIQQTSKTL